MIRKPIFKRREKKKEKNLAGQNDVRLRRQGRGHHKDETFGKPRGGVSTDRPVRDHIARKDQSLANVFSSYRCHPGQAGAQAATGKSSASVPKTCRGVSFLPFPQGERNLDAEMSS
uniref:Uncharacterized protein n=1 Tax=Physcomitrium patens TaxID=3218 RepID=A0A2K1IIW6_PHYPA|nr:hypothetical protein PHYPA_027907 [Physcomitrium patens]